MHGCWAVFTWPSYRPYLYLTHRHGWCPPTLGGSLVFSTPGWYTILWVRNCGDEMMGSGNTHHWRRPRGRRAWRIWRPIYPDIRIQLRNKLKLGILLNYDSRRRGGWYSGCQGDSGIRRAYIFQACGKRRKGRMEDGQMEQRSRMSRLLAEMGGG